MFQETDAEISNEICELTNFSSAIVNRHEDTPEKDNQTNLEGEALRDPLKKEDAKSPLPLANPYIASYLIIIVSAAVISNCIVLLVMSVRRKKLRTFQWCLISICVSDLLFSLLLHPMSIATALGYDPHKIFNRSGCLYFGVLALFFGSYDMVIHSLIAVLRYIHLCRPERTGWLTRRSISSILITCASYSAIWCIGPLFGIGKYVTFEVGCTMDFTDNSMLGRSFVNCAFLFIFFLPLFITLVSYLAILVEVSKRRKELENFGTVSSSRSKRLTVEIKLVRLTSVIASAYIIVWLPYAIVCLIETHGNPQTIPWIFKILSALFCKTGCATNPVIYLFLSKGFRTDTIETLRYLVGAKPRNIPPHLLQSSSQKSSNCRSTSQMSLRSSWHTRTKKEQSSLQKKTKESLKIPEVERTCSVKKKETSV